VRFYRTSGAAAERWIRHFFGHDGKDLYQFMDPACDVLDRVFEDFSIESYLMGNILIPYEPPGVDLQVAEGL
jgi:hypothetical protein